MNVLWRHRGHPVVATRQCEVWHLFWFVTDGDVQGKGWKAKYRFVAP